MGIILSYTKKSLEKGLKLLHTDNDLHSFFDAAVKNGSIHLYVAHKKQNLEKYYYENREWEEEDARLRCSSSTPFTTRYKRKISKSNMVGLRKKVKIGNKGKEKVCEDEGMCSKGNKHVVSIYKKVMVNGKAKMVEDVGGKEEMVSKRGVRSKKMQVSSVKVESE
ncbi:hypothetical protein Tco_0612573 [Tanacetum coccineum]